MARIIKTIEIEGQPAVALFDTGAIYTYVRSILVPHLPKKRVSQPVRVALGGKEIRIHEICFIEGAIEGLPFFADAVPVEEIGQADGRELDAIIGALTMERWEIRLDPKSGALDLEGLRRREFTEFGTLGGSSSVGVERHLAKVEVAGSNPVSRSSLGVRE